MIWAYNFILTCLSCLSFSCLSFLSWSFIALASSDKGFLPLFLVGTAALIAVTSTKGSKAVTSVK